MKLAGNRARALIDRGHLTAEEAQRLLEQFRQEMLGHIVEAYPSDQQQGPPQDFPITPEDMARILGMPVKELFRHFEEGGTFQQLARHLGIPEESLVEKMMELARQRLAPLVKEGQIDPTELERRLEQMREKIREELPRTLGHRYEPAEPLPVLPERAPINLNTAARVLGLSPEDLHRLLSEGHSLEEIARKLSVNLEKLIYVVLEPVETRVRHLLEAKRIEDEQAKRMLQAMRESGLRTLREFRLGTPRPPVSGSGPSKPRDEVGKPPAENMDRPQPDLSGPVLPRLASVDDVFRALGVWEKAADLRKRGLSPAHVARELGLGPDQMHLHLLRIAEERVAVPRQSGSLTPEQARNLLAHFKQLALEWVDLIFADVNRPPSLDSEPVDPATVTPPLASVDDVFRALGVWEKATDLRKRGLSPARVARELGFGPDQMHLHLARIAEERVAVARQSGSLTPEQARNLLAHFKQLALEWVDLIFATPRASGVADAGRETFRTPD